MAGKSLFTLEIRNEQSGILRPVPLRDVPPPDNRNEALERLQTRARRRAIC